jgi:mannose-6-phosphate isomerase-like protein (cupin superfamily)
MDAYELAELLRQQREQGQRYLEFLRVSSLSVGLYTLPAGGVDEQQPHTEDEVYYVVRGRAWIVVGEERRAVEPGSVVFVAACVPHRFYDISEELTTLVFFAPAEGSSGEGQGGT